MTPQSDPYSGRDRCTRTTRQGTQCQSFRVQWWGCKGLVPASCEGHLTEEERRRFVAGRAAYLSRNSTDDLEPACWSWPLPTPAEITSLKQSYSPAVRGMLADDDWAAIMMSAWHQGRCAICGLAHMHLVEDHDHHSGLVRGYLCRSCNVREGMNRGGIWAKYRERNPATICGVRERYVGPFWDDDFEPAPAHDKWKNNPMKGIGL